ncbi:early endosome antigen 1 [Triplophysa dalaica]|uniref:early endosome antigen 1 n=1 Tax=Triplophysa dalaica TaxID=1582913 RepID=UPI0024E034EE|nr:early endosome antigen 1 [Triplophysa dalaica]
MTTYQVPDVPAVRVALEHLGELDKRWREEGVSLSHEASLHLREIAEAIKELEASRESAREKLEVETIETSKLRHRTVKLQDNIKSEISACVNAAREGHTAELNRLRSELKTIIQDRESMEEREQLLEKENALLLQERENVQGKYRDGIDQLNQQLSEKASKRILLAEKQNEIQSLKEKIVLVQAARQDFKEDMMQKNKTFAENKQTLDAEILEIEKQIKEQRKITAETRNELDITTSELQDKENTIAQCKTQISQLEKNIARLTASYKKCKEWLDEKIHKTEELDRQKEFHERELMELVEAFEQEVQNLQEQIRVVEDEIEEQQKVRNALSEPITELSHIFSSQRKEEDDAVEEIQSLSKRLEECKLTHEKCITMAAKCKYEIKKMKEEMKQLHDVNTISADLFKKRLEELEAQLAREKIRREACDVEKEQIYKSLKTLKDKHKETVREHNDAIEQTERRYEELLEEEKKLQDQDVLLSSVIEHLAKELTNTEEEGKQLEINFQAEIQKLKMDAESITQARLKKEQELKVQKSILEQVNAQFNIDNLRHQTLKKQITELETQKHNLELSIQDATMQTNALLEPKDELKRELETSRAKHMEMLTVHGAEIRTVEKCVYENTVLLEQVNMENSRLHMCIERMKEEISEAQKDKEQYTQEEEWMREQAPSLFKSLIDAWTADMVLTKESADMEQKIMESMNRLMLKIQERKHDISDINSRLERELMAMNFMMRTQTTNTKK